VLFIVCGLAVEGRDENVETRELRSPGLKYSSEIFPPALIPANGFDDIPGAVWGFCSISEYLASLLCLSV